MWINPIFINAWQRTMRLLALLPEADINRRMTRRIGFPFVARNRHADAVPHIRL
jgi:hypothetical protein